MFSLLRFGFYFQLCLVLAFARRLVGKRLRPGWGLLTETLFSALKIDLGRAFARRPIAKLRSDLSAPRGMPYYARKVKIEKLTVLGQSAAWFLPPDAPQDVVLLYLHGGGFVAGSWQTTDRELVATLALSSGLRTLAFDYRLAPEHPYPAALEDVRGVMEWLREEGFQSDKIVIAGASAGGNLALAALLDARDSGGVMAAGAALLCPLVDLRCVSDSFTRNQAWDFLPSEFVKWGGEQYLGGRDPMDPMTSPLFADLSGLPPILLQGGEAEIFRDDIASLGKALEKAGNEVTLELCPDMVHVWQMLVPFVPEAMGACQRIGSFLGKIVGVKQSE